MDTCELAEIGLSGSSVSLIAANGLVMSFCEVKLLVLKFESINSLNMIFYLFNWSGIVRFDWT